MIQVKLKKITKEIPKGALKWYLEAGWEVIKDVKTNTKSKTTTRSKVRKL